MEEEVSREKEQQVQRIGDKNMFGVEWDPGVGDEFSCVVSTSLIFLQHSDSVIVPLLRIFSGLQLSNKYMLK